MTKFISTVTLAVFTAASSFAIAAGSDVTEKDKETMRHEVLTNPNDPQNVSKKEGDKYGGKVGSPSEKDRETMRHETVEKSGSKGGKSMSQEKMNKQP